MDSLKQLQRAWLNGNLIPFVGSGVSQGAAGFVGWTGLLDKGIGYARRNERNLEVSRSGLRALSSAAKAGKLLDGFRMLQDALGAPDSDHYQAFLLEQFSDPILTNTTTIEAIRNLRPRVVVTTNYDLLLEQHNVVRNGQSVTWLEPRDIFSLLRGGRGIVHLHGRFDYPKSVILSTTDYDRIVRSPEVSKRVAQALFHSGVLLFIGCSVAGVRDPHLSNILEEFARLQGPLVEQAQPHFILFKRGISHLETAAARQLGLMPIFYGTSHAALSEFLSQIPSALPSTVRTSEMRMALQTLRGARCLNEVLESARDFIEKAIYPGRKIRIGFAVRLEDSGRVLLRNKYLVPAAATHNDFSYPQTLAAWALIEGRILTIPDDWDRRCDFDLLRRLNKLSRVRKALMETNPAVDPVLEDFLDAKAIRRKTDRSILTIRDIYQHWVGRQPEPHYCQFVSVPVPIIERRSNRTEPPEYGVVNIDTPEREALLTKETAPLLKLVSDIITLGFKFLEGNPL